MLIRGPDIVKCPTGNPSKLMLVGVLIMGFITNSQSANVFQALVFVEGS